MGFLFDSVFNTKALFWSTPPYNLNWIITKWDRVGTFLSNNPINVVDIGARGGNVGELEYLKPFLNYYAFDADEEECKKLNSNPPKGFNSYKVFPNYIGENEEEIDFHLYNLPGQSSSYKPNQRFQKHFGADYFKIDRTVKLKSTTLNNFYTKNQISKPDMIKLDTQGSEFAILQNASDILNSVSLIETEVEFTEMYQNQALFHDISKLLYDNGFELLYLQRVFHSRLSFYGEARGQIIWGDALFGRREDKLDGLTKEQIAKYVILLINYGHHDLAHNILELNPEVLKLIPNSIKYFKFYSKSIFGKARRYFRFQIDKLIFILLRIMKTNKGLYDSDRCWPIR